MNRPVIGVDLDDVLWNFLEAWITRHNEITEDNVDVNDIKSWNIEQYIHKGSRGMLFYMLEQAGFWDTVKPKDGAQLYLKKLIEDGYDVVIVTATSYKVAQHKMMRFFELFPFIKEDQIITAKRKQLINVDILIDDNPDNLRGGFYNKFLFTAPHNELTNEKEIGAHRCKDWEELYYKIKKLFPIK